MRGGGGGAGAGAGRGFVWQGCVTFDLTLAPAMEFLIKSYPSWSGLSQLPVGEPDDAFQLQEADADSNNGGGGGGGGAAAGGADDDDDDVADTDHTLSLTLCALLTELVRLGIVESRKTN